MKSEPRKMQQPQEANVKASISLPQIHISRKSQHSPVSSENVAHKILTAYQQDTKDYSKEFWR